MLRLAIAVLLCIPIFAFAQDITRQNTTSQVDGVAQFYGDRERGWFWYEDPKELPIPEIQAPKPQAPQVQKPVDSKQPGSVAWLREQMPVLLEEAINNPSKENVEAYLYAQRLAMDKSQRYAQASAKVVANDPLLDENNRVPLTAFAKVNFLQANDAAKNEALAHLGTIAGLWLVFDSKCAKHCGSQVDVINMVASKHKLITKFISTDGKGLPNVPKFEANAGLVKALGLKITPTTILAVPPNNFYIVSQGVMPVNLLEDRLITVADSQELFPKSLAARVNAYDRGVLKTGDMNAGMPADAKQWVKYLKEKLGERY